MKIIYFSVIPIFMSALMARVYTGKSGKPNIVLTIFVALILILISGLRINIGDTTSYVHLYELVGQGVEISDESYEAGFIAFYELLNSISRDPQFMIFVTALITNLLNIMTLRLYPSIFELQIYLYILSGYFIVTMNGIRQALVASILFACSKLLIDGKFIPYAIIVLLSSRVHESALIMIPIYFIARTEAWSKNTMRIIGISSVGFLCFYQLLPVLFKLLGNSGYAGYEDALTNSGDGANIIRVVISSVPVIISFLGRDKLKKEWKNSNIFINISIINLIFMCFALYNWIFARFNIYFELYNFVLLPYCIKLLFDKKEKDLVYYSCIILYFLLFFLENTIMLGTLYKSNILNINI